MLTGTLDTDVAGGTDWVQVLTGTLPGSGAGWAIGGTGADGVTVAGIQRGPLHAAACRGLTLLQVSLVSVIGARSACRGLTPT